MEKDLRRGRRVGGRGGRFAILIDFYVVMLYLLELL